MAGDPLLSSEQTKNMIKGAVVGGLGLGIAVVAAPLVLPALGLAAAAGTLGSVATALPWLGAGAGAYWGYNKDTTKQ